VNLPALAAIPWAARYEALRRQALEGSETLTGEPLGLALVCRSGLAGWMSAWGQASKPPSAPPPLPPGPARPGWQHELTVLLAQMTARHLS